MQRHSYKERYFKDYHVEKKPLKNGKHSYTVYVYHGAYCQWAQYGVALEVGMLTHRKILYVGILLAEILAFAIAALWRSPVNTVAGTALTGCLSMVALLYQILYVTRFCFSKAKLKQIDAEDIHKYIRYASILHALLLVSAVLFGIIKAVQTGATWNTLLPVLFYLLSAACSGVLFFLQTRIEPNIIS